LAGYLSVLESIGLVAFGAASAFLSAQIARDFGKEGEKKLWQSWGGMPSMAIFRHRNKTLNPITKAKYHQRLAQKLNTGAPTSDDERDAPNAADRIYAAWSDYLRTNTRDDRFQLLHKENTSYGYRRNVWGLRAVGITTSLIGSIVCALRLYVGFESTGEIDILAGIAATFSLVLLILWLGYFTADWVRIVAESYAERLCEAIEILLP
jgi:hypothetical protein